MIHSYPSRRLKTEEIGSPRTWRVFRLRTAQGYNLISVVLLAVCKYVLPMLSRVVHPNAPFRIRIYHMPRYLIQSVENPVL
jgi:hypothetical protein